MITWNFSQSDSRSSALVKSGRVRVNPRDWKLLQLSASLEFLAPTGHNVILLPSKLHFKRLLD